MAAGPDPRLEPQAIGAPNLSADKVGELTEARNRLLAPSFDCWMHADV